MSQIERVHARQILDSRGNPTVEVEVGLRSGAHGHAAVPSGRLDRRVRGDRAARRRQRLGRQGRHARGRERQRRDRRGGARLGRRRPGGRSTRADRARRHPEQVAPRRQRDPRRLARRRARAGAPRRGMPLWRYLGGEGARVLPVPMMNVLNGGAHADNSVDFQEFMVVPCGAPTLRRVPADGRRGLPRAQAHAARARPRHGRRRRGRLRARPRLQRGGARDARSRASRRPATSRARMSRSRSTRRRASSTATARYVLEHEGRTLSSGELADYWADLVARYPIVSLEDGMDEEDWEGWKHADRAPRRRAAARRRRPLRRPTPSACGAASRPASPTRS